MAKECALLCRRRRFPIYAREKEKTTPMQAILKFIFLFCFNVLCVIVIIVWPCIIVIVLVWSTQSDNSAGLAWRLLKLRPTSRESPQGQEFFRICLIICSRIFDFFREGEGGTLVPPTLPATPGWIYGLSLSSIFRSSRGWHLS